MLINGMAWETPEYTISQVKKAGSTWIDSKANLVDLAHALMIINNWRGSHQYPLNIIAKGLRHKAKSFEPKGIVGQRIKRLPAIEAKLIRETTKLNQMQDIGGCRVILGSVEDVKKIVRLYRKSKMKFREVDYIASPRDTGYRGVHLIHTFCSPKHPKFDDLKIEMQIRTQKQHLWATAVETAGFYTNQQLKSGAGSADWLRFFKLVSGAISFQEKSPLVDGVPTDRKELIAELKSLEKKMGAIDALMMYGTAPAIIEKNDLKGHLQHFLIKLDTRQKKMEISAFPEGAFKFAQEKLQEAEKELKEGINVVLVSASSYASLKKAYPNYFLDTKKFVALVQSLVQ